MPRLLVFLSLLCSATATLAAEPLPRLDIAPGSLTVSGVSSGGYMAVQYHVAHSGAVSGAGVIAAGPWFCAQDSLSKALGECLKAADGGPDAATLVRALRDAAARVEVDDPAGLTADRVWLFHGSRDVTVGRPVSDALADFYRAFLPAERLRYETGIAAAHGVPTLDAGGSCDTAGTPWINDCDYDAAGEMLGFLYGGLAAPAAKSGAGRLVAFDQHRYATAGARASLAPLAYLYVPGRCRAGARCRVHVAFHGCRQGTEFVGRAFVENAGYNRWAEANDIVVLYPQVAKSYVMPMNPQGCWDWWGYTGSDYATRNGAQVESVEHMLAAIGLR